MIDGGDGNDTFIFNGNDGDDDVIELLPTGGGYQLIRTAPTAVTIEITGVENQTINGLGGDDTITIQNLPPAVLERLEIHGGSGDDLIDASALAAGAIPMVILHGDDGDDTILGSQGPDTINGGARNDLIIGNGGDDVLNGGPGDDTFIWNDGDGNDVIDGGDGNDTFIFNGNDGDDDVIELLPTGGGYQLIRTAPTAVTIEITGVENQTINGLGGDDTIKINDLLPFVLEQLTVNGGIGDDTIRLRGWAGTGVAELNGGDGADTFILGSTDDATGTLDDILGPVTINGDGDDSPLTTIAFVAARTTIGVTESVSVEVPDRDSHDLLIVNDRGTTDPSEFLVTENTVRRTTVLTGPITYSTVETVELLTGQGDDTVTIDGTAAQTTLTVLTASGNDSVSVLSTGAASLLDLDTGEGDAAVEVSGTGNESLVRVRTRDGADTLTILSLGDRAGIDAEMGDGDDSITLGPEPSPPARTGPAVIRVEGGAGADTFEVFEVFVNTVVDLLGGTGSDTFNLRPSGSTTQGTLARINDDPLNDPDDVLVAATRQLFIDGGDSVGLGSDVTRVVNEGAQIDNNNDGIPIAAPYTASSRLIRSAPCDPLGVDHNVIDLDESSATGDTINLVAEFAADPLDLRLLLTALGAGVLATVDNDNPDAPANEISEHIGIESIHVIGGSGDDALTIHSDIPITAASTGMVISFDGRGGEDLFRIVGTDFDDRITIRSPIGFGSPRAPFEIENVEFVRVDGFGGDDQIVNKTSARSVLNGGDGDDVLVGGSSSDLITGGAGIDALFGCEGDDILLPDQAFGDNEPDPMIVADGELIDGGPEDSLSPGDIAIQVGEDFVFNIESLGDGGAAKDVRTWIRAIFIPLDSISFDGTSPLVEAFGPALADPPELNRDNLFDEAVDVVVPPPMFASVTPTSGLHNGVLPADVNGDGVVSAIDALWVINHLARGANSTAEGEASFTYAFPDVNNDGRVTAIDALLVINALHRDATGSTSAGLVAEGEGESEREAAMASLPAIFSPSDRSESAWLDLLAEDLARREGRSLV